MPFTVNVGPYQGGQYLAAGLGSVGEGLIKTMTELRAAQKEEAGNQAFFDYAKRNNLITPEQQTAFLKGNSSARSGIMAEIGREMILDQQRKQNEATVAHLNAQAEYARAQAHDLTTPFTPTVLNLPTGDTDQMITPRVTMPPDLPAFGSGGGGGGLTLAPQQLQPPADFSSTVAPPDAVLPAAPPAASFTPPVDVPRTIKVVQTARHAYSMPAGQEEAIQGPLPPPQEITDAKGNVVGWTFDRKFTQKAATNPLLPMFMSAYGGGATGTTTTTTTPTDTTNQGGNTVAPQIVPPATTKGQVVDQAIAARFLLEAKGIHPELANDDPKLMDEAKAIARHRGYTWNQ